MLQVEDITRCFGPVVANNQICFDLHPGEVVGLLGENGAGKSTLLAVLAGYLQPDSGSLRMEGQPIQQSSPGAAIRNGFGLVHQHLSVVPSFTVREQLMLGGWQGDPLPEMIAGLDLDTRIDTLAMGERQRLEIAKTLLAHPRVLLLDEPTSILAPPEVDTLLDLVRDLRTAGLGIVLVTHKLREVLAVADMMVVLRLGSVVGTIRRQEDGAWPEDVEEHALGLMFGWDPGTGSGPNQNRPVATATTDRHDVLRVEEFGVAARGVTTVHELSFTLQSGRLYVVAGIDGQGQRELALAIAGYLPARGDAWLQGQHLRGLDGRQRAEAGIGLLVDDRIGEAAIGSLSLSANVALKRPRPSSEVRGGLMQWAAIRMRTEEIIRDWNITPSDPERQVGTLSGGNMQRLLAGRELDRNPHLLLAINPVQGLDWQTTRLLWERLRRLCQRGGTVLAFTGDLEQALEEADEVAVMSGGRLGRFEPSASVDPWMLATSMVNGW